MHKKYRNIEQYREQAAIRQKRWRERKKAEGYAIRKGKLIRQKPAKPKPEEPKGEQGEKSAKKAGRQEAPDPSVKDNAKSKVKKPVARRAPLAVEIP